MGDTQDVTNGGVNDSATTISNEAERQRLLEEVKRMKDRIYELQSSIGIHRFSELELEKDLTNDPSSSSENEFETRDVEAEIQDELFQLAGIWCSRFDEDCVFNFRASNSAEDDVCCVQILNDGGNGKLGSFCMPVGLDVQEIANVYPIKDFRKVMLFLRNCKRYLHCYSVRQRQCSEMKEVLSAVRNCTCQWVSDYTSICIKILGVRMLETAEVFDVTVHLKYKIDETLPFKLYTKANGENVPDGLNKMLNSYYKCFKEMNLKDAFEEICGNRSTIFSWTKIERFHPINDVEVPSLLDIDSSETENELSLLLDKSRKGKSKREKAKNKARHEQTTHLEESLVDYEKSEECKEEDTEESDLLETTKQKNAVGPKKINKKVDKGKQQTILNFDVKTKKREVEKDVKAINDNDKITQNEGRNVKNGTEKNQTKKDVGSKAANSVAKSHEQMQSRNAEKMNLKQLEKASKTVKNTEAMKTKRFEQLYKELNEVKEKEPVNDRNQEENPTVFRSEKHGVTSKYKVQNKQAKIDQMHKINTITNNQDKNHQSNTKTATTEQNKDSDESQSDTDKELPVTRHEEVQSNNAANPEVTKNKQKTKTIHKNRIANKFMTPLDDTDKSETSSKSSDSDEDENRPATNKLKNNTNTNMPKNQKKHRSTLLTPSTAEDTDEKATKYNIKNRQQVKRKKLSFIQEIGTDTEDQTEKSDRIEQIEPVERKKSNEKGDTISAQSLNQPIGLRSSTPLSLNENQSQNEKKSKIAAMKFRRLKQIREQDTANVEVINSTPICGEILNEVNFSELAEISNIPGSDKDLGGDQQVEKESEREGRSSLENSRKKRRLFQDGEKNRKRSQIHEEIEAFRGSLSNEKEDNSVVKGEKKTKKSAEKTKKVPESDPKKGKIGSRDRHTDSSGDSESEDDSGNGISKISKDKAKNGKVSDEKALGDSQNEEERRTNNLLNKDENKRDKSVKRGIKTKRIPKHQGTKTKVLRKHMETESSADSDSEEEVITHKNNNSFSNGKTERGKSAERNKARKIPRVEVEKRKISRKRIETELSEESEIDEDLRNNNSLYNDKNERVKSVESTTARKKKKSEAVGGREEIEFFADSDNGQKKKNKEYNYTNLRDKSVERDRAKKLLQTDAKKRKPLQSNEETESSESEDALNKRADNLIREDKNKRGKSVERGRSRKFEIDAKKGKTSHKHEEMDFSGESEPDEHRKNTLFNYIKNKRKNIVGGNGGKKWIEDEVKKQKIEHAAVSTDESDINERRNNDFFNGNKKKRYKRSAERNRKSSRKVDENKENNPLSHNKNKRSKSMERSMSRKKVINIEDKRNAKENWSEIVNTDSSDHYLSDEDTFNDQEVLKDLAYVKEARELKPMTTKYKNNIKKKTKKHNYCVK